MSIGVGIGAAMIAAVQVLASYPTRIRLVFRLPWTWAFVAFHGALAGFVFLVAFGPLQKIVAQWANPVVGTLLAVAAPAILPIPAQTDTGYEFRRATMFIRAVIREQIDIVASQHFTDVSLRIKRSGATLPMIQGIAKKLINNRYARNEGQRLPALARVDEISRTDDPEGGLVAFLLGKPFCKADWLEKQLAEEARKGNVQPAAGSAHGTDVGGGNPSA